MEGGLEKILLESFSASLRPISSDIKHGEKSLPLKDGRWKIEQRLENKRSITLDVDQKNPTIYIYIKQLEAEAETGDCIYVQLHTLKMSGNQLLSLNLVILWGSVVRLASEVGPSAGNHVNIGDTPLTLSGHLRDLVLTGNKCDPVRQSHRTSAAVDSQPDVSTQ